MLSTYLGFSSSGGFSPLPTSPLDIEPDGNSGLSIAIIAILCIMSMLIAFGACQKGGDDATPSGQPSGNAPSGSVDSGEIPSGSIDSGDIDSGDTVPSGSVDSGDAPTISHAQFNTLLTLKVLPKHSQIYCG